jgi:hypothetical protein
VTCQHSQELWNDCRDNVLDQLEMVGQPTAAVGVQPDVMELQDTLPQLGLLGILGDELENWRPCCGDRFCYPTFQNNLGRML